LTNIFSVYFEASSKVLDGAVLIANCAFTKFTFIDCSNLNFVKDYLVALSEYIKGASST